MTNESPNLDTIYTLDEAAERLRLTKRGVAKIAKRHGLCSVVGRQILFSEKDLLNIWQVTRAAPSGRTAIVTTPPKSDYQISKSLRKALTKEKSPGRIKWELAVERNNAVKARAAEEEARKRRQTGVDK